MAIYGPALLAVVGNEPLLSIDKNTGQLIDTLAHPNTLLFSGALLLDTDRFYSTKEAWCELTYIGLTPDGHFTTGIASPETETERGSLLSFTPDHQYIVDSSGMLSRVSDLSAVAGLGGKIDLLGFSGNNYIILRGSELISYSPDLLELGRFSLPAAPVAMYLRDDVIYTFYSEPFDKTTLTATPVSALVPRVLQPAPDPTGLAFLPDQVVEGENNVIYLLSKANKAIYPFDLDTYEYSAPISLFDVPSGMDYHAADQRLYVAYPDGKITYLNLDGQPACPTINAWRSSPMITTP